MVKEKISLCKKKLKRNLKEKSDTIIKHLKLEGKKTLKLIM